MYNDREEIIRQWFNMWLTKQDTGISKIFTPNAIYCESWGPKYVGSKRIKQWFDEWNTRGKVYMWDIKQYIHGENQTIAEWYFKCVLDDGTVQAFDGVSLVKWNDEGQIEFLKEYGCNTDNYDPYENGSIPQFKSEKSLWF